MGDVSIPGNMIQGGRDYTTAYASFIFYDMATSYRESKRAAGRALSRQVAAAMRQAGSWFANRTMVDPDLAWLEVQQAQGLLSANRPSEALSFLRFAEASFPDDADIHYLMGQVWLALGRPETARSEFTLALTERTDFAEAYYGRAEACNRLGDVRRAQSDLDAAAAYGLKRKGLKITKPEGETPEAIRKRFDSDAEKNRSPDTLTADATALVRSMTANGIRYDETYQDTLRGLEDAVRKDPGRPEPYVAVARYLIQEADNRTATVVPAEGALPFRRQVARELELQKAMTYADKALAVSRGDVRATVAKALALQKMGRTDEAEALIRPLVQSGRKNDPEALRLYAEFLFKRAGEQEMAALMMRQSRYVSSSHNEWRSDGLWEVTTTTRYDPSPSDLQRAANLEYQARANLSKSQESLREAVAAARGTMTGYFLASDYELWFGDRNKALSFLTTAVQKYPGEITAYDHLAAMLRFLLRPEDAVQTESRGLQLVQTSAAPLLGLAWNAIASKAYPQAEQWLQEGLTLDPSDARLYAYRGVIEEIAGDTATASRYYRMALSLSEARLAMDEPQNSKAVLLPRPASDFALSMRLREKLAAFALRDKETAGAMADYAANASLGTRFSPGGLAQPMFEAMFPDPNRPEIPSPRPDNGATLLATANLELGKLYQARGNQAEAERRFTAAASLGVMPGRMIPNVGNAAGDTNFSQFAGAPAAEAQLRLAEMFQKEGRNREAFQLLQAATQNHPADAVRGRLNTLINTSVHALNEGLDRRRSEEAARQQQEMDQRLLAAQQRAAQNEQLRRSGAPVDPDLVGTWRDQTMTLAIEEDGAYRLTTAKGASQGRIQAWNSRMTLMPNGGAPIQAFYRLMGNNFYQTRFEKNILQLSTTDGQSHRLEKK